MAWNCQDQARKRVVAIAFIENASWKRQISTSLQIQQSFASMLVILRDLEKTREQSVFGMHQILTLFVEFLIEGYEDPETIRFPSEESIEN
jgi:hypothetical protein